MTRVKAAQRRLARALQRSVFPEVVAGVLCLTAAGFGVVLVARGIGSSEIPGPPPWSGPFSVASPAAWGAVFLVAASMSSFAVLARREAAAAPLLVQTFVWVAWSALLVVGSTDGGVPTSAVGSIAITWLTIALTGLYWLEGHTDLDAPVDGSSDPGGVR